jgi:uncharacterized C2H2 Zn-finger protein
MDLSNSARVHTRDSIIRNHNCGLCGMKFRFRQNLRRHIRNQHEIHNSAREHTHDIVIRNHNCGLCGMKFRFRQNLRRHIRNQHEIHNSAREHTHDIVIRNHNCGLCGMTFTFRQNLRRHIRNQHEIHNSAREHTRDIVIRNHNCGLCGMTFTFRQNLRRHLRNQHEIHKDNNGRESPKDIPSHRIAYCLNKSSEADLKTPSGQAENRNQETGRKILRCTGCQIAFTRRYKYRVARMHETLKTSNRWQQANRDENKQREDTETRFLKRRRLDVFT